MQTLPPTVQTWTVLSLIEWSTNHLLERNFDEARLHAEMLLAHILKYSRLQLYTNFDRPLTRNDLASFKELFKRRLTHEPLQYILGETEFMGLPFSVNKNVLIPRPETELLVEKAIDTIKLLDKKEAEILDIGTGSGNIAIAIAALARSSRVTSIDISNEALRTAKQNAERNDVSNVTLLHADMLSEFLGDQMFDGIVSNPPYISAAEFNTLQPEIRDFEPRIATTDDLDGYTFIRRVATIAMQKLNHDGFLLMEIGYGQSDEAKKIVEGAGLKDAGVIVDYNGIPRILSAHT